MTEHQSKSVREIVDKLEKALKGDEYFERIMTAQYTNDKIEFSASIKQMPRYKYISCEIGLDELDDENMIVSQLIESWHKEATQENIKKFLDFIAFGEKYGWD